eukprot:CAMPEP_0113881884 /NCGR_PEP_ID=MMETSP0780_2-20120614/8632_1 /TAXON_ID=652834 /ORGANISM="Palpitomonas bilix" /LENGTH=110 /DNA_ID=CAMNT_0000868807 /DNA_START=46 /DNA_END=378 /DNA_ORIENTATION=- /assembly_acc=CAM_ASM_000599
MGKVNPIMYAANRLNAFFIKNRGKWWIGAMIMSGAAGMIGFNSIVAVQQSTDIKNAAEERHEQLCEHLLRTKENAKRFRLRKMEIETEIRAELDKEFGITRMEDGSFVRQ